MKTCGKRTLFARCSGFGENDSSLPTWIVFAIVMAMLPICQCRHTVEPNSRNPFTVKADEEMQRTAQYSRLLDQKIDVETNIYAQKLMDYLKATRSSQTPESSTLVIQRFRFESLQRLGRLLDVSTVGRLTENLSRVNLAKPVLILRVDTMQVKPAQ